MLRDERLRERPIESLNLTLHFWSSRIGMEMDDALIVAIRFEMVRELAPIIGLDVRERKRCHLFEGGHEVGGMRRGVGGIPVRKRELRFSVDCREHIALDAVRESDNGISFHEASVMALAAQFLAIQLGFSLNERSGLAVERKTPWVGKFALLFEVAQHSARRGRGDHGDLVVCEKASDLLFTDALARTFRDNEIFNLLWDHPLPSCFWSGVHGNESYKLSTRIVQGFLPPEEGGAGNFERLFGRGISVVLPEREDAGTFLGVGGDHIPKA